jgi:SPP1 gp7 family putative phage head morphogenesis protein
MAEEKPNYEVKSDSKSNALADLYTGTDEQTFTKSSLVPDSYDAPYNSDDLWKKAGDYSIYEDMCNDDQVGICLQLKKDLIVGDGGMIVPVDEEQEELANDLEALLFEKGDVPFDQNIEELLSGIEFGFSLGEKIFKLSDDGQLTLGQLKVRHPNSWLIHQDDHGNVTKYEQTTSKGAISVEPKRLLHYINNPKFQNPYGKSDLRTAYNAWFAKRQVVKYMAIFLEKAASPIPVGRYDKNAPPDMATRLLEILRRFQTKTAITIPKEVEVDFLEAKNNGDVYVKAIHLFNMFIGRSLFIPDLLGFSGAEIGAGSFALGKEQMALFFKHIARRRKVIEGLIDKHFIQPICVYNYGFMESYPKFKFKPLDDSQATELAKTWLEAVKGKLYKASDNEINHFRKLMKFPEGDVEREAPAPAFGQVMPGQPGQPIPGKEDPKEELEDKDNKEIKDKMDEDSGEKKTFGKVYDHPTGDYYKKCDFKAIETKLNDYDQSILNDAAKVVRKMVIDLFDQIERKRILQSQNTERIDTLSLKYKKELKQILKASFNQLYLDAQSQASQELYKSNFAKPIATDKFLEVIEDEAFKFVGDYEYGILKRTRQELIAAIKDGKPLSAVANILTDELKKMSEVQIERFARTKHTEVMNNARKDFFNDSGVVTGYQYSAVLDKQTSDICRDLHGKKFPKDTAPTPPMHFNCRSVLIPITKFEEFQPSKTVGNTPIDTFIEENKGKGFATFDMDQKPKRPEITDPGVEFETQYPDELTEVITYKKDSKDFQISTAIYSDKEKTSVKSLTHKRLDNESEI